MHSDVNPLHKVFAADFFSMQHVILEGDKDNIGWQKFYLGKRAKMIFFRSCIYLVLLLNWKNIKMVINHTQR